MLTSCLVLDPYYKLAYCISRWLGRVLKKKKCEASTLHAKDWHNKALQIAQRTMKDYWNQEAEESNSVGRIPTSSQVSNKHLLELEYDHHCH
jgi:hypothetical protein